MIVKPDTETLPDAKNWLDQLDDSTALEVMLKDHGHAIDAVRKGMAQLETAVTAIVDRLRANNTARIIYAGAGAAIVFNNASYHAGTSSTKRALTR